MTTLSCGLAPFAPGSPTEMLCVPDPPHGWDPSHAQFNGGAMDGFVTQYNIDHGTTGLSQVMEYLNRTHVPVTWALADAYTTCDRWFASVMGPTLPNRAYWHTATSFGQKDNSSVLNKFAAVPVAFWPVSPPLPAPSSRSTTIRPRSRFLLWEPQMSRKRPSERTISMWGGTGT